MPGVLVRTVNLLQHFVWCIRNTATINVCETRYWNTDKFLVCLVCLSGEVHGTVPMPLPFCRLPCSPSHLGSRGDVCGKGSSQPCAGSRAEEPPCTQSPSLAIVVAFLLMKEAGCMREFGLGGREGGFLVGSQTEGLGGSGKRTLNRGECHQFSLHQESMETV